MTGDWIRRAERALQTGQPRLAMLYMRRALAAPPVIVQQPVAQLPDNVIPLFRVRS